MRVRGLAGWLQGVAPPGARGAMTIALVSDARMRALSNTYRGRDATTDVLSFPAELEPGRAWREPSSLARRGGPVLLGDIAIARGVAARQARQAGHSLGTELRVLALHGLLHLIGYDHVRDSGQMRRLETRLRRKGGLHEGLIERAT